MVVMMPVIMLLSLAASTFAFEDSRDIRHGVAMVSVTTAVKFE